MNSKLRNIIRRTLLVGSAGVSVIAMNSFAGVPGIGEKAGMIPDYFGVVPNYANSPQPLLATVQITDATGTGALIAATTYDYINGVNTDAVMDVQIANGGSGYSNAPEVTVTGGPGSTPVTLTAIVVNGVITGFSEIPTAKPADWKGLGSGYKTPITGTGLRKFVDSLPLLDQANNLGQQLPVAVPDTTTFPGSDYYEIAATEYAQKLHSDLAASHLRGYKQLNAPTGSAAANNHYLGPIIIAQKDRPVRVKFVNLLPTGDAGNLPLPVDHSYMGSNGATDTDNRAAIHMHGGNTPWISDGTVRQWIKPKGEAGPNKGISATNVPDMWFDADGNLIKECSGQTACNIPGASNNPGDGALTYFFTNQQSQRLMFYHDHAEGVTRLNVYDGMAAGYVLQDETEKAMTQGGTANGVNYEPVLPEDMIPLVIQEKTFVPDNSKPRLNFYGAFTSQLNSQDPTWRWGTKTDTTELNGNGDLWVPHVYMPNQNPGDMTGGNAVGRWDYGPWFWPPFTGISHGPLPNPYYDPQCVSSATVVCQGKEIPGGPNGALASNYTNHPELGPLLAQNPELSNPSGTPEAFNDTPLVNGTIYPFMNVEPKKYRLRILSVGNDRVLNLSMVVAASKKSADTTAAGNAGTLNNSILCDGKSADVDPADCTEVKMVPFSGAQNKTKPFPGHWYSPQKAGVTFDDRNSGVFDPGTRGPAMVQIGTEGGFLSSPTVIPNQPVNFEFNPKNIVIGNIKEHALLLGPAERADVVVDFSQFAGSTIILYNDSPAPVPAFDLRYDLYTGDPDNTDTGGAFTTLPGYGPNTRTVLQFRVAANCTSANCGNGINRAPETKADVSPDDYDKAYFDKLNTSVQTAFRASQEPIIVPQSAYNPVYGTAVNDKLGSAASRIGDSALSFAPLADTGMFPSVLDSPPVTLNLEPKAIIEDFTTNYGRMNALLGVEVPHTTAINQTSIPQAFIDPPTELVKITPNDGSPISGVMEDGTQLWKVTHNGVDTHAVHFHLFHVQLVNRVGWDGAVSMPDANELGWKDTVRMNPLEDIIVALRPKSISLPFKVPNSHHVPDPSAANNAMSDFYNLAPNSGNVSNVTNTALNYGWEYLWHCHILGHEENDMMRTISVAQAPEAPSNLAQTENSDGSVTLTWDDNSMMANSVTIQRDTVSTFNSANLTNLNVQVPECDSQASCSRSYIDTSANQSYFYRLKSNNTVGAGDANGKLDAALAGLTPGFTGYDNVTASSTWSNTVVPLIPVVTITPMSIDFGNQALGVASAAQTITITNNGQDKSFLKLTKMALGTGKDYSMSHNCPSTLAANTSCTINVVFKPSAINALADTLTITDNNNGVTSTHAIALSGTGKAPIATLSTTNLSFGNLALGLISPLQTVTLSNTGNDDLLIANVALASADNFMQSSNCPAVLVPNSACNIVLNFKPVRAGMDDTTLTITDNSNGLANSTQTVTLAGTGVNAPIATVTPTSLTFKGIAFNTTSAAQSITVKNTGTLPLTISGIATTAPFTRPTGAAGGNCGTTLAANASCTINVTFKTATAGVFNSQLTITDNTSNVSGSKQLVTLTGSTLPVATIAGTGAFGNQVVGTVSASKTFTITNSSAVPFTFGNNSVKFTSTAGQFAQTNTCNNVALLQGQSCAITMTFKPTTSGAKTETLNVALPDGGKTLTAALTGTGGTQLSLSTTSFNFGTIKRGSNGATKSFTVKNMGGTSLTMANTAATVTGNNASEFKLVSNTCNGTVLAANGSCTVAVTFAPSKTVATGNKSSTLNILGTGASSTVALTGKSF